MLLSVFEGSRVSVLEVHRPAGLARTSSTAEGKGVAAAVLLPISPKAYRALNPPLLSASR